MVEFFITGWLFVGLLGVAGRRINLGTLEPMEIISGIVWGPVTLFGELYRAIAYQDQDEDDKHWTG